MALTAAQLAYHRAYQAAHREEKAAAYKRWYEKHGKESREKRLDTVRESARAYYHRNKDKSKEYAIANRERIAARISDWQKANRPVINEYNRKRWLKKSPRYKGVTGVPEGGPAAECQICGSTKRICMDHCHKAKVFRGWLCTKCNCALGMVGDSVETLERIIDYLKSSRQEVNSDSGQLGPDKCDHSTIYKEQSRPRR